MTSLPKIVVPKESQRTASVPVPNSPCAILGSHRGRMLAPMLKTIEFKIYPNKAQAETLDRWLGVCCWIYNQCLEHRIKAFKRRRESVKYNEQQAMLTEWRSRIDRIREIPVDISRDSLRRVDRGFKAFFRRLKSGEKPGFPRFRSRNRFNSIECLVPSKYVDGRSVRIPKLGRVRSRGPGLCDGGQRLLRIVRRANGWFAQVLIDDGKLLPVPSPARSVVGVDVGLTNFATLSTGENIDNPRWAQSSHRKLRHAQRRLARRQRWGCNRRKSTNRVARIHERIAAQRRSFCHQETRKLVNRFDLIGFENLNIRGMVRNRKLARSIMDAAWGMFTKLLVSKAESAGKLAVGVHAPGTSQECPWCGAIKPKNLSERIHHCSCRPHESIDRDHAAAMVIRARALVATGAEQPVEESTSTSSLEATAQVGPTKQAELFGVQRTK